LAKQKSLYARIRNRLFPARKERRQAAKAEARAQRFASEEWQRDSALARRGYDSYESYVAHQASKLDVAYERRAEKDEDEVAEFTASFDRIVPLAACRNVLCLGARLGAEVRALRDLGYFAVGIDLNPGKDNPYVHYGDFHALAFRDGSVDAVYTNALDHVFDLARVVKEVHRVLRPDGLFIADVLPGFEEGFLPGRYEATYWRRTDELLNAIMAGGPFSKVDFRELPARGRNPWSQALFRKEEGPAAADAFVEVRSAAQGG
jgi:SAM-dependent methyltransferase